jgi:hypothetical protein
VPGLPAVDTAESALSRPTVVIVSNAFIRIENTRFHVDLGIRFPG